MPARRVSAARPLAAVILAGGEGKRFKSESPKVLHDLCGRPMLAYVLQAAAGLKPKQIVVVVGRQAERVKETARRLTKQRLVFAVQQRQLGTGDAARVADEALGRFSGDVVILPADTPLITPQTLRALIHHHRKTKAAATVLTVEPADPTGYGRIVRDERDRVERIVEQTDASAAEKGIGEVNGGVWVFDRAALRPALTKLERANRQGEYYLTDVVEILRDKGEAVEAYRCGDAAEAHGVNSRVQLAHVAALLRARTAERLMNAGVTIVDPDLTYLDDTVRVGRDTVLEPMTFLTGSTRVGTGCRIGPGVRAHDSTIGNGAAVSFSVLNQAAVGPEATVGPYAYLRPGARLARRAKAGTFVEIKGSSVGEGAKVPHLSYVGDALIGPGANVGAGTVTCNYDGERKHRTRIGAGAFIGSDTMLVAPVRVGRGAYTAAGSAITKDVPAGALGIERAEQRNVAGWATGKKAKAGGRTRGKKGGAR